MIRFSCADYTFPLLAPARRFALLQLLGFEFVDIGLFERSAGLRPSELAANPKAFLRQMKSGLTDARLQVADIFLQIGVDPSQSAANDPSPMVRARNRKTFLRALDVCAALGCAHLTGLPGVQHKKTATADDLAWAVEETGWRQHAASGAGIRYAIEPHIGSICFDVASTRALLDAVPGLTLALDYGHFIAAHIDSGAVHPLLPFASHIHVRGGAPGRLQVTVKENKIDFRGMVRRLDKLNYRGFLAVEYVWTDWQQCDRTDNVSESILLRDHLAGLMARDSQRHRRYELLAPSASFRLARAGG